MLAIYKDYPTATHVEIKQICTREGWIDTPVQPLSRARLEDLQLTHRATAVQLIIHLPGGEKAYPDYQIGELI